MNKVVEERYILKLASPLLSEIYGEFEIDISQTDKPDAAIIIKADSLSSENIRECTRIGIEITKIDKRDDLQYWNDEKVIKDQKIQQIERLLTNKEISNQPDKRLDVSLDNRYIYEGTIRKQDKYSSYAQNNKYKELIVLVFSEFLNLHNVDFEDFHIPWANYWLSESKFPFDKVIFVCTKGKKSMLVYDKNFPKKDRPKKAETVGSSIDSIKSQILPIGVAFKLDIFNQRPIIEKTKSGKKKKSNK